jgi:Ca-activated chloride channel family protein
MTADGVLVELGSFWSGEQRKLVLTFDVPGIPALGLAEIARLDLGWVELPALVQHNVSVPVHVNVVPGDQAAGRVPNPVVRSELAFQQTQRAKRRASDLLSTGQVAPALSELHRAHDLAVQAWKANPGDSSLQEECNVIGALLQEAQFGDMSRAAKLTSSDVTFKSRTRGRRTS